MCRHMSLLMAIAFFVAGALCIQRPERIAQWLAATLRGVAGEAAADAAWLRSGGVAWFIRLVGVLALINAVALLYTFDRA